MGGDLSFEIKKNNRDFSYETNGDELTSTQFTNVS